MVQYCCHSDLGGQCYDLFALHVHYYICHPPQASKLLRHHLTHHHQWYVAAGTRMSRYIDRHGWMQQDVITRLRGMHVLGQDKLTGCKLTNTTLYATVSTAVSCATERHVYMYVAPRTPQVKKICTYALLSYLHIVTCISLPAYRFPIYIHLYYSYTSVYTLHTQPTLIHLLG
jgi:hypothetical protein